MVFGLEQEDGSFDYTHGLAHPLHPIKTGRGISTETCGLDDVFPPDDLGSGLCTPFIIYIPHIIATFLLSKYTLSKKHTKSWYNHAGVLDDLILCGFRCAFSCMFQYSLCHGMDICAFSCMFQYSLSHGMDIGTCDIVHWSAAPHEDI